VLGLSNSGLDGDMAKGRTGTGLCLGVHSRYLNDRGLIFLKMIPCEYRTRQFTRRSISRTGARSIATCACACALADHYAYLEHAYKGVASHS